MTIRNFVAAAVVTVAGLMSADAAFAMPPQVAPAISMKSDVIQVRDRRHYDDGDHYDRRDRRNDDRRYWRLSRAERWYMYHHRRGWDDGGWHRRPWMYGY